jgi:hypothetical protein
VIIMAKADTKSRPEGQYTVKMTCPGCGSTIYASAHWNQYFGGWKCVICKHEQSS